METAAGQNEMTLWWRAVADGAEVTAVETSDRHVVLPETIQDLPVTALGHHAFSPDRSAPEGTPLRLTCGGGTPENDTRKIETITLPPTLRRVGDYAFYNCTMLGELRMTEPVETWGGSVFMNCGRLCRFSIRARDNRAESVAYFADELPVELDVTVEYPDGERVRLIFPEYRESYEENSPAHHFDFHLYGPGYPYHHVFRERALPLAAFDALFPDLLATEHDPDCAMRLAWYRLRFPRELTAAAAAGYLTYLNGRTGDVLNWLLEERDSRGLAWFLPRCGAEIAILSAAAERARRLSLAEPLALLLEHRHRKEPDGLDKSFDL